MGTSVAGEEEAIDSRDLLGSIEYAPGQRGPLVPTVSTG